MIRVEDECVECPSELGCLGSACPYKDVVRYYCDECKDEYESIYYFDGQELCIDCIEKRLERVEYNG